MEAAKLQLTVYQPDVVLTDHEFPDNDESKAVNRNAGFELIEYIRRSNWSKTPIIWHSGSFDVTPQNALANGTDYAFTKPVDFVAEINPILQQIYAEIVKKRG